jgi:hypothetical protein
MPCDHQVALEDSYYRWRGQERVGSCYKKGEEEHLATKALEAKWQLIHTNGIWIEVEGIREEPALASRKLALLSSSQLPSFITQPPPDVAANSLSQNPVLLQGHAETLLPAPSTPRNCVVVHVQEVESYSRRDGGGARVNDCFLIQLKGKGI